jgi:hypothetical protein
MTRRLKLTIILAGIVIIITHFSLMLVFSFSPGKYSFYYVYPFFQQNWALFIPPPSDNYKLLVRYKDKEMKCVDVFSEILTKHQTNRLNGNEPLLIALSNSIHYFEKEEQPDTKGINFKILEKFAINYLNKTRQLNLDHAQLFVMVSNSVTGESRTYHN